MKYRQEQNNARIQNASRFLKILSIKIASILIAVTLILALIISVNFFRYVVFGESTLSKFKNNFFGIPSNKLLKINQQLQDQCDSFKQWTGNLKARLSK